MFVFVFFFCELCTKCSRKTWKKTLFSHTYLRDVVQKAQKNAVFSHFLRNFVQSVSKNVRENTVFSHFLWNVVQNAHKNFVLWIFCELCAKCLEKREKKTLFSHTLLQGRRAKKARKTAVISHIMRSFVQNVSKNVRKYCFLTLFVGQRAKAQKKTVFFAFSANFVQSVSKNVKNTVFSHFFWGRHAKSSKTLFFRIFG